MLSTRWRGVLVIKNSWLYFEADAKQQRVRYVIALSPTFLLKTQLQPPRLQNTKEECGISYFHCRPSCMQDTDRRSPWSLEATQLPFPFPFRPQSAPVPIPPIPDASALAPTVEHHQ